MWVRLLLLTGDLAAAVEDVCDAGFGGRRGVGDRLQEEGVFGHRGAGRTGGVVYGVIGGGT